MATKQNTFSGGAWQTAHVDSKAFVQTDGANGNYISSESCVIVAGPAKFSGSLESLKPIGLVENFQAQQQKGLQPIWEIGSKQSYFLPGRNQVQLSMTRVMFHADSLMAAVSAGVSNDSDTIDGGIVTTSTSFDAKDEGLMAFNAFSTLFSRPFGLGVVLQDSENNVAGVVYFENCALRTHQMALQSQQTVIMENVSMLAMNILSLSTNMPIDPVEGETKIGS